MCCLRLFLFPLTIRENSQLAQLDFYSPGWLLLKLERGFNDNNSRESVFVSDFPPSVSELLDEFNEIPDWDERYEYLIELGRELPPIDAQHQTKENLVHGCMSTVWLVSSVDPEDRLIEITADSDSLIVKGLIVVLLSLYQRNTAEEVLKADERSLFKQLGLDMHLSPNRRNGLFSMVGRIKQLATESLAGRD